MAKISLVSAKYIIHATIQIDGVVDRPDIIGAIFGQTEGLLGEDLELRELQRSGRIGRIEVNSDTKGGKSNGTIIIPSSLDKAETAIVAAALEIIQRIGPCNSKIHVEKIEDVRISKRKYVVDRAKELLGQLTGSVLPDSQELADEVAQSVRVMEISEWGPSRLPAGPGIDDFEEVIIVEGRADVLNLLKHGFKNCVSVNGTNIPEDIKELCKQKTVTAFVDGDRGGDLILKELLEVTEVDFCTKAPDGKEVEEITKKEIHKALRSRITAEQAKLELTTRRPTQVNIGGSADRKAAYVASREAEQQPMNHQQSARPAPVMRNAPAGNSAPMDRRPMSRPMAPARGGSKEAASDSEKKKYRSMLEDLIGTRGAYILDQKLNIMGKVPTTELSSTLKSLNSGIHAVVFDGDVDGELMEVADKSDVKFLIAMNNHAKGSFRTQVLTADDLDK